MARQALWRKIEEMNPQERREYLVGETELEFSEFVTLPGKTGEWLTECPFSCRYDKVVASFQASKEWKQFRVSFLTRHPTCSQCGGPANVVHHQDTYRTCLTILDWGLSWIFDHPECCNALCTECHFRHHERLIANRKRIAASLPDKGRYSFGK